MSPKTHYKVLQIVPTLAYESTKRAMFTADGKSRSLIAAKRALLQTHSTVTGKAPLLDSN